jgi:DNA-binding transcriptional LysR family regulator
MSLNISIEALEIMDAIDRKGSFAAAAESLFRVPSALTYSVKKLEQDLGITLFDRSGHRATLTAAGVALLKEGRQLLNATLALESKVKRIATGIETDINIAISDLLSMSPIFHVLADFYAQNFGTRIKLSREVFGGSWDALLSGRADISVGAPGDAPPGGGYTTKLLGQLDFVFAIAPHHPLAQLPDPLNNQDIIQHRAVAAADSSRHLAPRTSGILSGQDVLTVPDMRSKVSAQIAGLGVGFIPRQLALQYPEQLMIKEVAEAKPIGPTFLAWRNDGDIGIAQQWLLKQLGQLSLEDLLM